MPGSGLHLPRLAVMPHRNGRHFLAAIAKDIACSKKREVLHPDIAAPPSDFAVPLLRRCQVEMAGQSDESAKLAPKEARICPYRWQEQWGIWASSPRGAGVSAATKVSLSGYDLLHISGADNPNPFQTIVTIDAFRSCNCRWRQLLPYADGSCGKCE